MQSDCQPQGKEAGYSWQGGHSDRHQSQNEVLCGAKGHVGLLEPGFLKVELPHH